MGRAVQVTERVRWWTAWAAMAMVLQAWHVRQAEAAPPLVTVRLFVDAECPHSRKAWPRYRQAITALGSQAQLLVHHLPSSQRVAARVAAEAAWAARQQGKELAFLDALLASETVDAAAIEAAARSAGVDTSQLATGLQGAATAVDTERQAALAFGVRATPSALINGVGLGGVPEAAALTRSLRQAQLQAADRTDPERVGLLQAHPEFVRGLDALRTARSGEGRPADGGGAIGTGEPGRRSRLLVSAHDLQWGADDATVQAVAVVDPALPWSLSEAANLARWSERRPDVAVSLKLVSAEQLRQAGRPAPPALALLGAACSMGHVTAATAAVRTLLANATPWTAAAVEGALARQGLDVARLRGTRDQPAWSAWLHNQRDTVLRSGAQPGRIYLNGRVWWGMVGERGWTEAVAAAGTETRQAMRPGVTTSAARNQVVMAGLWRSDEELDLSEPMELGDLTALPALGNGTAQVVLLVDPQSFASRAAWVMLQRLVQHVPMRLRAAMLPHTPARIVSAFTAAIALGKWPAALDRLLAARDVAATAEALAVKLGVPPAAWRAATAGPKTWLDAVTALQGHTDWGEEPILFIGARLYVGPLDEARIERAIRWVQRLQADGRGG